MIPLVPLPGTLTRASTPERIEDAVFRAWTGSPNPMVAVLDAARVYDRAPERRNRLAADLELRGYRWDLVAEWLLRAGPRWSPRNLAAYFVAVAEGRSRTAELGASVPRDHTRWLVDRMKPKAHRDACAARAHEAQRILAGVVVALRPTVRRRKVSAWYKTGLRADGGQLDHRRECHIAQLERKLAAAQAQHRILERQAG